MKDASIICTYTNNFPVPNVVQTKRKEVLEYDLDRLRKDYKR